MDPSDVSGWLTALADLGKGVLGFAMAHAGNWFHRRYVSPPCPECRRRLVEK